MKKTKKSKSAQTTASSDQDIVVLITTLVQKLVSLEGKIDTILSRTPAHPVAAPQKTPVSMPVPAHPPVVSQPRDPRPMHKAVCADCGKNCEVPFKPSAGRSVYCKECFTARRNNKSQPPQAQARPNEAPAIKPQPIQKPEPVKAAATVSKKKPAAKKAKKPKKR